MSPAAIIFALLTAGAALFLLWRAWDIRPQRLEPGWDRDGLEVEPARVQTPAPLTRRDLLPLLILTAAYAAVAYWGLGDRDTPQSWQRFAAPGDQVVLTLAEEAEPGRIAYFTGPQAGSYRLDASADGKNWTWLGELDQSYSSVLRWKSLEPEEGGAARYLRVRVNAGPLDLGELAAWDREGRTP